MKILKFSGDIMDLSRAKNIGTQKHMEYCFGLRSVDGIVCEFGVFEGNSLRNLIMLNKDIVFGFDCFTGLTEDWYRFKKNHFAADVPKIPMSVLIIGEYKKTLKPFFKIIDKQISFVHIDCDTYSATASVFDAIKPYISKGTIIVFDELFGYDGWEICEYKALIDSGISFEIVTHNDFGQAGIIVSA